MDGFDALSGPVIDEDPAAAFLAQQESEIAGIESDGGFIIQPADSLESVEEEQIHIQAESNGPTDTYATVLQAEPESLRRWRDEQKDRLELLDAQSRTQESEWKEKAKVELEEWYNRQDEQQEKIKVNNRVLDEEFYKQPFSELIGYVAAEEAMSDGNISDPGTEWDRVARLCDFNPKSSKQAKDVSRMRSVLISLKQAPLVH